MVPVYNRKAFIAEAIQSVQGQTYECWELVVVDDGSTDGSQEVVRQLASQDNRIKLLLRDREPKGAPSCRNIGAKAAAGDYIIFLDSDDLLAPWCLEQRVACFLQHPEADFLTFSMLTFERNTEDAKTLWNISTPERGLVRFRPGDAVWQTSGPIYRKDFFQFLGGFAEDLPYWQDYEFHVRTLVERPTYKKYLHLPPDCYNRRHSEGSISQQGFHSEEKLLTRITIYQDIMRLVEQRQLLDNVTGTAIVVFSFNQARKLVVDHKNLIAALVSGSTPGQKGKLKNLLISCGQIPPH